jgi:hypothetical protein
MSPNSFVISVAYERIKAGDINDQSAQFVRTLLCAPGRAHSLGVESSPQGVALIVKRLAGQVIFGRASLVRRRGAITPGLALIGSHLRFRFI